MLPSGLMDQLADPKWKERLEACDKFKQVHTVDWEEIFTVKKHFAYCLGGEN